MTAAIMTFVATATIIIVAGTYLTGMQTRLPKLRDWEG